MCSGARTGSSRSRSHNPGGSSRAEVSSLVAELIDRGYLRPRAATHRALHQRGRVPDAGAGAGGRGPGHRAAPRLGRLGRHVAAAAGAPGRARAPRDRRRPARLRACGPARRTAPVLPQLDAFAAELARSWAEGEAVVLCGNSLGGLVALRLAAAGLPGLAGVVPVAPAGLDMPGWFDAVRRDPLVRRLLALPLPLPSVVMRAAVGTVYERLAFSGPGAADPALVASFAGHHAGRAQVARLLASGRRLLPELQDAAAGPRGDRLPGAARVGNARPDGPAHGRARAARGARGHGARAARRRRALPAARGDRAPGRAAARVPGVIIGSRCPACRARLTRSAPPSTSSTRPCAAASPTRAGCRRR